MLAGLAAGCRSQAPPAPGAADRDALWHQYRAAIADARTAEPDEVASLTPIVPGPSDLRWRTRVRAPGDTVQQVRVVTWRDDTPLPGAAASVAAGDTLTLRGVVWVTAVPELRGFCQASGRTGDALDLRLRQRLGVPPDFRATRFVELWVPPLALVRPCPDPSVTDRSCSRVAPRPRSIVAIDSTYRAWFDDLRATSYAPDGYPWTRLGYTYDWNPQTDEVGPSEFIVWPAAHVAVEAVHSTAGYCAE